MNEARDKAMVIERDEGFDDWPGEIDPIAVAICPLIAAVFELTAPGSPARAAAMGEVLQAAGRVRAVLHRPRLN